MGVKCDLINLRKLFKGTQQQRACIKLILIYCMWTSLNKMNG